MFPHFAARSPFLPRAVFTPVAARDFYVAAAVDQAFCIFHHGKSALSRIDAIEAHDYATPDTKTYSKNEARVLSRVLLGTRMAVGVGSTDNCKR